MKKELKNPGVIEFSAAIIETENGAYVEFPFDTQKLFGTTGRIPVFVEFDGQPYRGTRLRYGTKKHIIILVKKIREAIGKQAPDVVQVKVKLDNQPWVVELPADLKQKLEAYPVALENFNKLSYTHQKAHVDALNDAKKEETRQSRIEKMIQKLS
jgi:hypothetical protein